MTYHQFSQALTILGLGSRATLQEIRKKHRELVKAYHPDSSRQPEHDCRRIQEVNEAYQLISSYINSYQFSFSEEEFYIQNPEESVKRQFMNDPIWGG